MLEFLKKGKSSAIHYLLISFSIGGIVTLIVLGGVSRLNPKRFDWIFGDNITAYLAQLFFLSDQWRFPLTANPNYGSVHSTPLTYTGPNLPLTILQKLLRINPELQFFGIWILITITLQVWFALILAREIKKSWFLACLFSLLTLTPFFLFRFQLHFWLTSHFLILWSILVLVRYLKYNRLQTLSTLFLVNLGMLLSPYILVMTLGIVVVLIINSFVEKTHSFKEVSRHTAILTTSLVINKTIFDGIGTQDNAYESIKMNFSGPDYGKFPFNLVSFLNPEVGLKKYYLGEVNEFFLTTNFSSTGVSLGSSPGSYEGFLYLGLGVILLGIVALLNPKKASISAVVPLNKINRKLSIISIILVVAFSATYNIGLGNYVVSLPFPYLGKWGFSAFRSSGRFMWVIAYLAITLLFIFITSAFSRKNAARLLLIAAILQILDLSKPLHARYMSLNTEKPPVLNFETEGLEFFQLIGRTKERIVSYPPGHGTPEWDKLNYWAWKSGMTTNSNQSGRINYDLIKRETKLIHKRICVGRFRDKEVYVVHKDFLSKFSDCQLTKFIEVESLVVFNS